MTQFIGNILSYALYYMGDLVSKPMHWADWLGILYPLYNNLMCASSSVQRWGGKGPWQRVEE